MDFLIDNIGWILLAISVLIVISFKRILGVSVPFTSQYKTSLTIKTTKVNTVEIVLEAFKKSGFTRVEFDSGEDSVFARSKISSWSWTERIKIGIKGDNPDEQTLEFVSTCALPTQIIAWGKNRRNAMKFIKALEQIAGNNADVRAIEL